MLIYDKCDDPAQEFRSLGRTTINVAPTVFFGVVGANGYGASGVRSGKAAVA